MGSADIVPGVSGGTVALILGIYTRLITAISHFDLRLLLLVRRRRWRAAAAHVDLRFLIALAAGISLAIVSLANLIRYLLHHHTALTYAAFFGLILASSVLVARWIQPRSFAATCSAILLGATAALVAYWLVGLEQLTPENPGYLYYFGSGAVAISAMILPGISGAHLLMVLGIYEHVTGIISDITKFTATPRDWLTLFVFACGCGLGLLCFSKFIKVLLTRFHATMMAVLAGFMLGSLRRVWPFQNEATPPKLLWPDTFDAHTVLCGTIALVAATAVFTLDRVAGARRNA